MTDDELREALLAHLEDNRTTGAAGAPLRISDANLVYTLGCDPEQLTTVLESLIEEGVIHGKETSLISAGTRAEWDCVRLVTDPLPKADPRDLD